MKRLKRNARVCLAYTASYQPAHCASSSVLRCGFNTTLIAQMFRWEKTGGGGARVLGCKRCKTREWCSRGGSGMRTKT